MQFLRSISNQELHEKTMNAAVTEKKSTLELLEHLAEIDRRRVYAMKGFSSLWEYVHKALGYSEAQAWDRVTAMRLIEKVPEVKKELTAGTLTLTAAAKLGAHVKREKLNSENATQLVKQISGKSSRETEKVLLSQSTSKASAIKDKVREVTPTLTRITIEVDNEFIRLMDDVRNLRGNPSITPQEIFKNAMLEYVNKRLPKPVVISDQHAALRAPEVKTTTSQISTFKSEGRLIQDNKTEATNVGSGKGRSRYIARNIRNIIRNRSQDRCEFVDPMTMRRCESRSGLQFDHIMPFAKGGTNDLQNLRHYCPAHNQLAAINEFGSEKMKRYLN